MNAHDKSKPVLTFAVYQNGTLVRRETVAQDIVKIGKDPRSHLRVDCEEASRMHAVLEVGSISELTLIDLGNEPGTLVNGHRINKCQLRIGDQIQIGPMRLDLERAEDTRTASPALAAVPAAAFASGPFAGFSHEPYALAVNNPFLAPLSPFHAPVTAQDVSGDEGEYAMIKSGPAMHPDEVEIAHASAIEIIVKWDTNVLHVAHLSPPRSFILGESGAKGEACDYLLPAELIGTSRTPLVVERAGSSFLVIPHDATGTVALPGEAKQTIAQLVASGRARPSTEVSLAMEIELQGGARATVKLAGSAMTFEVNAVNAGKRVAGGFLANLEATAYKFVGLSFLAHAGTVAALAFFMPHLNPDDAELIDRDQIALMRHYLDAHAVVEKEELQDVADGAQEKQGGEGERAKAEEGVMGSTVSKETGHRYAIEKRSDDNPHLARERALKEAADWGVIGILATATGASANEPIAAWARDDSNGRDSASLMGNMWGMDSGESAGLAGLGLTGTGSGGGGPGEGIGLGTRGLGHGDGCLPGEVCVQGFGPGGRGGYGIGHGPKGPREHVVKSPRVGNPSITVNGRLPPEVIQRIVRQNYGRFRLCYEGGLRSNPGLTGRVSVNFSIGRDGAVMTANDGGSDIPDQSVIACVTRAFTNLSFPQPEGGIVTIKYPLVFTPE